MAKKIFIGGAWPYANNSLHIGHLAALLPGDVLSRFFRKKNLDTIYVSGSDCHGTPITIRAANNKVEPESIAKHYHKEFCKNFDDLQFTYDLYPTTMDDEHKKRVIEYIQKIKDNGHLYSASEETYYCKKCSKNVADRELSGTCPICKTESNGEQCEKCLTAFKPKDIQNPKCKLCQSEVSLVPTEHLYFKMSALTDEIKKYADENSKTYSWRQNAINETAKYLKEGLRDRAITRDISWGIKLPFKGFEDKRLYVWVDAVLGYFTTGAQVTEKRGQNFETYIKDEELVSYYIHGKDNIVFHTIILPSLLHAIDEKFNKPNRIISCEYINLNSEKMSKSKGNLVTVNNLLTNFNTDSIRFFFTKFNPENKDSSFSYTDFVDSHNKMLLGGYGNFANRNLAFLIKQYEGRLPFVNVDPEIEKETKKYYEIMGEHFENGRFRDAMESFYSFVQFANTYYDRSEPWKLCKSNEKEFFKVTSNCLYMLANLANLSSPVMPKAAKKLSEWLKFDLSKWESVCYKEGKLPDIEVLFTRLELAKINTEAGMENTYEKTN
ncbi:MAG: methionine--tRNA ligase [Firmicutes bacterium]|nr:methionine--tRNA ligase [Bacillota bacterium]